MLFYKKHIADVLAYCDTTHEGLSPAEAARRLKAYGPNTLRVSTVPLWKKLIEPFRSIFVAVLFVAAGISIAMEEVLDAVIILVTITISVVIYYVQQASSERVLNALKRHDVQLVRVVRGGVIQEVNADDLVVGDIVQLYEGERIPADIRIIESANARVDEAMLTGESLPIGKDNRPLSNDKEVYERTNMLFQGSFVVAGHATGVVVATANETEFGQIAALARRIDTSSPVQQKIDSLLQKVIIVIGCIAALVFALSLWRGVELLVALRFMISLAVSAVPEGLPIAISIVLVLGMRRMAKHQALVRNLRAIENIGIVTTIATDKTGTLTKNQLSVQDVWQLKAERDLRVVAADVLLTLNSSSSAGSRDPLDAALARFSDEYDATIAKGLDQMVSLPFDQAYAMSGVLWRDKGATYAYMKGAPEKILAVCRLSPHDHELVSQAIHSLTGKGLRVIAIARAEAIGPVQEIGDLQSTQFEFICLVAVADQLRPEAQPAIAATLQAGVTVRMITGDHFETAYAIGKKLGLVEHRDQVFDAREMERLDDEALTAIVDKARVFSRVTPESKHRILTILKQHNITAMTGDGVNDVPALSNAHIGVAMGSGSQIAKDAGDIILLNDSFASIVTALREGRVVFDNIRRMLYYLFATSTGQVLTIITALLAGLPAPLVAVQILWINLVTDTVMVIPLGLEPAEDDVMKRRPRNPARPIIGKTIITRMIIVALTMVVVSLCLFAYFLQAHTVAYAQTIIFSTMVAMQWANGFVARSERQSLWRRFKVMNVKFYIGVVVAIGLQALALFGPLATALHVDGSVSATHYVVSATIGIAAIIIAGETHKRLSRSVYARVAISPAPQASSS